MRNRRRPINGAVGWTASSDGRVRRWGRVEPIKQGLGGHLVVVINGEEHYLDTVICRVFNGEPPYHLSVPGMCVKHANGDILDCSASNLSWNVDPDWYRQHYIAPLMRPDFIPRRRLHLRTTRRDRRPNDEY
jgi:hypothetical protein